MCYKMVPFTTDQIKEYYRHTEESTAIDPERFLQFRESIELGYREYENSRKVFTNDNILLFNLVLQAFMDLNLDIDFSVDLFLLFKKIYKKQLMDNPLILTKQDEIMLSKFLQVHALKAVFGDELIGSLQIVKSYTRNQLPVPSLKGIFATNFEDNSIDFQHKIIQEFFITSFIMDNIINVQTYEITATDAKILVRILALVMASHTRVYHLINFSMQSKYKTPADLNKLQRNLTAIVKKAQYWTTMQFFFQPSKPKLIDVQDGVLILVKEFDFWEKFHRSMPYGEFKHEEVEKQPAETRKENNRLKYKPSVKGVTTMKKLNCSHEISNQLNEFLEDVESGESFDVDEA